jgi:hypothetical protein
MLDAETLKEIDAYQDACNRRMAAANQGNEPSDPLFHYTNDTALRGIIASGQFWFTSIYHMDDPKELDFGFGLAKKLIVEGSTSTKGLSRAFCLGLLEGDDLAKIRELISFYSVSFGLRDDAQQWESYAAASRGVAVGFSPDYFKPHPFEDPENPRPDEIVFYGKVAYGDEDGRARHAPVMEAAYALIDKIEGSRRLTSKQLAAEFCRNLAATMYTEILWNCVTTKDASWQHQNEMRMLARNFMKRPSLPIVNAEQRPRVEISQAWLKESIVEVIVGPNAEAGAVTRLRKFLAQQGLPDVPVIRSQFTRRFSVN